jgi:hypothetical protein
MSVKIESEVINNIINSYNSLSNKQTRTYGIIFGTKTGEIYYITKAIYGYIFEDGKKDDKIIFNRLNNEILNLLLSSLANNYQNLIILGGFATDVDLFPELLNLYTTINIINNKTFPNDNSILLLIDAFHCNPNKFEYGIKTYKWNISYHTGKNKEDLSLMSLKEIPFEIVQKLNTFGIINEKGSEQFKFDIGLNKLSDSDFKNVIDELEKLDEISENVKDNKSENLVFVKTQLKICSKYLELIQNYLNNIKESDIDNELLNKIMMVISMLKPIFEKEEIANLMKKEHNHNRIVSDLVNILNIQAYLTDKINKISF